MRNFMIGVDGGGTKTHAVFHLHPVLTFFKVIIDKNDKKELASFISGSSNKNSVGMKTAKENILESIFKSLEKLNSNFENVDSVCLGLSGIDAEIDKIEFTEWIKECCGKEIQTYVYNDTITNMSSGTLGNINGLIVISGTGSVVLGTDGKKEFRAGGWGPLLGDEGGGYVIGNDALCAYTACVDGTGESTILVDRIKKELDLKNDYDIVSWTYSDLTWARIANLAKVVFQCCEEGDIVSKKILVKAVNGLLQYINVVVKKLNWIDSSFQIVLCGKFYWTKSEILSQGDGS
eukprot:gene3886-7099_t